jgi:hypothetical protein
MRAAPIVLAAALASLGLPSARSEPTTPARAAAFAKLPNWSGEWGPYPLNSTVGGQGGIKMLLILGHPPYKPDWEKAFQARIADRATVMHKSCIIDYPGMMESPQPFEMLVTPEQTLIIAGDGAVRHIYTDGRGHPKPEDLWPTLYGDSIGRWEGGTLVIDTIARKAGPDRFVGLLSFSGEAHFVERIRETAPGILENQMTIEDPVAFTQPWKLTLQYQRLKDIDRIIPYECEENDRVEIVDGKGVIAPRAQN